MITFNRTYRRLLLPFCAAGLCAQPRAATLRCDAAVPRIQFAAGEIHRAFAARGLHAALAHWKRNVAVATAQYKAQLLHRAGNVDLNALTAKVAQDLALADACRRAR